MAGATETTPLRLKDLLELDCDSCSAAGFRCYPRRLGCESAAPVRHLLESPSLRLRLRRPSKLSHLSRSLSRRLGFWRGRDDEEDAGAAAAAAVSSAGCGGSSSEEQETSSSESSDNSSESRTSRRRSRSESDSDFSSAATEDSVPHHPSQGAAAAGDEHETPMKRVSKSKEGSSSGSEADDKEQLSPVAVMDFPAFDEDEDEDEDDEELRNAGVACSPPSFSLARLQRRKTHKIRRFGSRDDDELAPLNLEALLAATSDDLDGPAADVPAQAQQMIQCRTEDAAATPTCASSGHHRRVAGVVHDVPDEGDKLISLLMGTVSAGLDDVSERLLLDFFVEMKRRRSEAHAESSELPLPGPAAAGLLLRQKAERLVDGEAVDVAAARGWFEGTGTERWGLKDVLSGGAAIVAEMERGRRWMQVGEEEREVAALVAGMLADQLVSEVVRCLVV